MNDIKADDSSNALGKLSKLVDCCVPKSLFEVNNLSVSFADEVPVQNVSITLNEGCLTAIVGPSGCGKSTFLLAIAGLLGLHGNARVSGSVRYRGAELYSGKSSFAVLRRELGFIFQKPTPLPTSIYKNITIPLIESGVRNKTMLAWKVEESLKQVGLWEEVKDRLKRPASQLSGGQQQRMCLARTLALEPKVILMDEPASSLDPISGRLIEELIVGLKQKTTIVLVTHNLLQARRIADYLAVFSTEHSGGSLVESGKTQSLFTNKNEMLSALLLETHEASYIP